MFLILSISFIKAAAYFTKKNRTDNDSFKMCYQDIHELTLLDLLC